MSAHPPLVRWLPLVLMLAACSGGKSPTPADAPAGAEATAHEATPAEDGVLALDEQAVRKLGLQTEMLRAAQYREEKEGYAQVWSHEAIAQLVAELSAAESAQRQSAAALERIHKLADTPGAFPADALEAAQRQQGADQAALLLAQRKLSALLGDHAPLDHEGLRIADLASGRTKLVRITFPIGSRLAQVPRSVRLLPLDAAPADKGWASIATWEAPADNTVPGRSMWAAVAVAGPVEGDRLVALAPDGAALPGVLVPDAALVVSEDRTWCFVEKPAGTFRRSAVDTGHPLAGGYVVAQGLAAGDRVVTRGAGLLLARATGAGGAEE